jgi:4-carboxymuconolactone decarboxylase
LSAPKTNTKEARRQDLLKRHNRKAVETGQRLQGEFFLKLLDEFDQLDPEWTESWLNWIYDDLYNRNVLDPKTRVLIVIGECCVSDEQVQLPNHIRSAMELGATPKQILEVVLQSAVYAGMPKMIKSMRTYRDLMKSMGVLKLTDSEFRGDAQDKR